MDPLFEKLLNELDQFVFLATQAPNNLTEEAKKDSEPTKPQLEAWKQMLAQAKQRQNNLTAYLKDFYQHSDTVDQDLGFFRSLPRYLAEIPCVWSAYYDDIQQALRSLCKVRRKIDKKYKLGQHKDD